MSSADQIIASLQGISAASFLDEPERIRARDALFHALRKVQSPWEIAWDQSWACVATTACVKTLIDAGVFKKWSEVGGGPITCVKLAEMTGVDEVLLRRIMRTLSGQLLVIEVAEDTYERTPLAIALADDPPFAGIYGGFYHDATSPMFRTLPAYLKKTGYRNPTDVNECNFQYCQGNATASFFEYIGADPLRTSDFNDAMECLSKYNSFPWTEVYPSDSIVAAARPGIPLVVDIGGSKGHDLRKFLSRYPDLPPGSLVLENLPILLKSVDIGDNSASAISVQPHDFFTPQPVVGARAYYMHHILHDWPDDKAIRIMKTLAPAMEKGYSRLLIHESLVSKIRPLSSVTVSDNTQMMTLVAASERTEERWEELISSAGLRLIKIWRPEHSIEGIIEEEVA
ncbi:O-methyltransferase-like protein [Grosmannia clavigera kw1407]|uniref:O-methyltransferase-like protein n=1 Tax=Grosmannia clavigera (strain kw1407 / UAMH 11150) TaxID=655863 RepID=F0XQV0_GROCL|nr:O-methyltransferase-like protein [Grosmannia clavigera kw1407]EFW99940.1 O-methyltransferase-like protein [Grosmannia clavigera kw1407]